MSSKILIYLSFILLILNFQSSYQFDLSITDKDLNKAYKDDPFDFFNYTNIVSLNYKNISTYFAEHSTFYIIAYDKYIPESAKFMQVFIETANFAHENNMGVPFVMVNGKYNDEIFNYLPIKGYPCAFFVHKKVPYEYLGPLSTVGLLRFLSKKVMGAVFEIDSVKEIENQVKDAGRIILSTIKDKTCLLYKSLETHAELTDDIDTFGCTTDECIKKYGENEIVILKTFDEKINKFSDYLKGGAPKINMDSVYSFFGTYGIEMGGKLDEVYEEMLFNYDKQLLYYCRNESDPDQTKFDKVMKEVGPELRKKNIYSLVGDIKGTETLELIKDFFAIEEKELPVLLFYDLQNANESSSSYRINNIEENQLTKEKILDFVKDVKAGKIERDIRTERPMSTTEMRTFGTEYVVGKNFEKDVLNSTGHVCVLFSMEDPGCPICREYVNEFKELSNRYKNKEVALSIFDAKNNEVKGMEIKLEELPFVLLYKDTGVAGKKKEVIKFVPKDRTVVSRKELEKFINKNIEEDSKEDKNVEDL